MRKREEKTRTGELFLIEEKEQPSNNAGLLFLVTSTKDIPAIERLEEAIDGLLQKDQSKDYGWHSLADRGQISSRFPFIKIDNLLTFEATEFTHCETETLKKLFAPLIKQMEDGKRPSLFNVSELLGSIAKGPLFLKRDEEIEELTTKLQTKNLLMIAPRRTGKTSVLHKLQESESHNARYIDLQSFQSNEELALFLASQASQGKRRELAEEINEKGWVPLLTRTLQALQKQNTQKPFILMLDELVYYCANLHHKDSNTSKKHFITLLRVIGKSIQELNGHVIVTGSSALDGYLKSTLKLHLSELPEPFSKLEKYKLKPLGSTEQPVEFRKIMMGTGLVLEDEDLNTLEGIMDLSMPYQAMCFFQHIKQTLAETDRISADTLHQHLKDFLMKTTSFNELETLINKRNVEHPTDITPIEQVTTLLIDTMPEPLSLARVKEICKTQYEEILSWMLDTYPIILCPGEEKIQCVSKLFAHWWRLGSQ